MRNLLALIGLAVVGFGGVGWYMGWYKLSVARTTDGNLQINTTVDTKKAGDELADFSKNVGAAISTHVDKAAQDAKTAPQTPAGGTPGPVAPSGQPQPKVVLPEVPLVPGPLPPAPTERPPGVIPLIPPKTM